MKHWRLITTSIILVLVILLFGFGVFGIMKDYVGIANVTVFNTNDEHVFVKIEGEYTGPVSATAGSSAVYLYELNREKREAYGTEPVAIDPWNIGSTNFVAKRYETIVIKFVLTNLNAETGLNVSFEDIAVDYESKFETSYRTSTTNAALETATKNVLTPLDESVVKMGIPHSYTSIPASGKLIVELTYTLKSYSKSFSGIVNNIKVNLTSAS